MKDIHIAAKLLKMKRIAEQTIEEGDDVGLDAFEIYENGLLMILDEIKELIDTL